MRHWPTLLALAVATGAGAAAMAAPRGEGPTHVTAQSRYGNGSLTAPVRPYPLGWQVRLPGGAWIDCARDCADTLRRESLDFWETQREESDGDGDFK